MKCELGAGYLHISSRSISLGTEDCQLKTDDSVKDAVKFKAFCMGLRRGGQHEVSRIGRFRPKIEVLRLRSLQDGTEKMEF